MVRCSRRGLRGRRTRKPPTRTSSTPPPTSARSPRCSPIRSSSSLHCGCRTRAHVWTIGFVALGLLIALCGADRVPACRGRSSARLPLSAAPPCGGVSGGSRLSFVPSGLLVAVTAHISTDVAAAPLLWVLPLALYLMTFVLAFRPGFAVPAWLGMGSARRRSWCCRSLPALTSMPGRAGAQPRRCVRRLADLPRRASTACGRRLTG